MTRIKDYPLRKIITAGGGLDKLECGHEIPKKFYENIDTGELEPTLSVWRRCYLCPVRKKKKEVLT